MFSRLSVGYCLNNGYSRFKISKNYFLVARNPKNSYGVIGPDLDNPYGCVPCFCFGHSNTCTPASHMVKTSIDTTFDYGHENWAGRTSVQYNDVLGQIVSNSTFRFPEKYLGNQRYSYNQFLSFNLGN